jgi:preprotein translocase subunit SecE
MAKNLPDDSRDSLISSDPSVKPKGLIAGIMVFLHQVVVELRKVVTPSRSELVNYALVVLVFVVIVMAIITVLDLLFGWAVSWVFGDGSSLFSG